MRNLRFRDDWIAQTRKMELRNDLGAEGQGKGYIGQTQPYCVADSKQGILFTQVISASSLRKAVRRVFPLIYKGGFLKLRDYVVHRTENWSREYPSPTQFNLLSSTPQRERRGVQVGPMQVHSGFWAQHWHLIKVCHLEPVIIYQAKL